MTKVKKAAAKINRKRRKSATTTASSQGLVDDVKEEEREEEEANGSVKEEEEDNGRPKPVWVDEDDEAEEAKALCPPGTTLGLRKLLDEESPEGKKCLDQTSTEEHRKRLREQYRLKTVYGREPKWARMEERKEASDDDDEEEEAMARLTRFAGPVVDSSRALPARHLDFKLLRDPTTGFQRGAIVDLKFHPVQPVLVTASTSGRVGLFQLCEEGKNPVLKRSDFFLQSVAFPKFRLDSVAFFNGANSLLATSLNHGFCYTYDLMDGAIGQVKQPIALSTLRPRKVRLSLDGFYIAYLANTADVFVFELKTMNHVHTFRGSSTLVDFCFSPTEREVLYAQAVNGQVSIWDLRRRAEQVHFYDEGCVRATCIQCSHNGQFVACGSNTGIVNVYDLNEWSVGGQKAAPKPDHTFDQLTTSISWLRFSRDSQLMGMGSDVKKMSARLGHCSTGTVFENFPAKQEHFATPKLISCDFSPHNAFCAVGTTEGSVRLYRINHFKQY